MIIERVVIKNFRKYHKKEAEFVDGLNAIAGENGSGKSSIVMAIMFAFGGIGVLNGLTLKDLKPEDGPEDAPTEVSVSARLLNGGLLQIKRTDTDCTVKLQNGDNVEEVTGITSCNAFLQNLTKLSLETFKIAGLVAQDELSAIAELPASQRKKYIRSIADVEVLKEAVNLAKEDEKELKTKKGVLEDMVSVSKVTDVDDAEVERLHAEMDDVKKEIAYLTDIKDRLVTLEALQKQVAGLQKKVESVQKVIRDLSIPVEDVSGVTIEELEHDIRLLVTLNYERSNLQKYEGSIKELGEGVPSDSEYTDLKLKLAQLKEDIRSCQDLEFQIQQCCVTEEPALPSLTMPEEQVREYVDKFGVSSIVVSCPVCKHTVSSTCQSCGTDFEAINRAIEDYKKIQEYQSLREQYEKFLSLKEQRQQFDSVDSMRNQISDIERLLDLYEKRQKQVEGVTHLKKRIKELESQLYFDDVTVDYLERCKALLNGLKQKEDYETELNGLLREVEKVRSSLKGESDKDTVQAQIFELQQKMQDLTKIETEMQNQRKEFQKYQEVLADLNKVKQEFALLNKTRKLLNNFYQEVSSSINPIIESFAEPLLCNITGGKMHGFKLDSNFNITVSGRPYNRLSGGEKKLVCLCLRLGVAYFIKSMMSSPVNFLILDEVFGSFNEERAVSTVAELKALTNDFPQVIFITHGSAEQTFVDNLIKLS